MIIARVSKWTTVKLQQVHYSIFQMPKIINKLIGKGKQRENSATLPLPDISSIQGRLASLDLDDTISLSSIPISIKYKLTIDLFELSSFFSFIFFIITIETEKIIDFVAVHGLKGDVYKTLENYNGSV